MAQLEERLKDRREMEGLLKTGDKISSDYVTRCGAEWFADECEEQEVEIDEGWRVRKEVKQVCKNPLVV